MKTLSELQRQLEAATAQLEEVAHGLADLRTAGAARSRGELARFKALGERYPIRGHCLCGREATLQREYLTLLAGLLLTDPAQAEGGWLLLQRIAAGGDAWDALPDALAGAGVLAPEKLDGYTGDVSRAGLGEALLLDAMLLALAAGGSGPAYGYIAGLAELLGCPAERLEALAALAAAVAERDGNKLQGALRSFYDTDMAPLLPHLLPIRGNFLFRPDRGTLQLEGDGKTPVSQEILRQLKRETDVAQLVIRNARFSGRPLSLVSKCDGHLTMTGCVVENVRGRRDRAFLCQGFQQAELDNCLFQALSCEDTAVDLTDLYKLTVRNTRFHDLTATGSGAWTIRNNARYTRLESVTMEKIKSPAYWYYGANPATVKGSGFRDCKGRTIGLPNSFKML